MYIICKNQRASFLTSHQQEYIQEGLQSQQCSNLAVLELSPSLPHFSIPKSRICRDMKTATLLSLALRLMISSTTNCATERDHVGLCLQEPNFILFLRMPSAAGFTNTSFRCRGVVCYDDHQLRQQQLIVTIIVLFHFQFYNNVLDYY